MKSAIILTLVICWLSLFFFAINQLLHMEFSCLYCAREDNPTAFRIRVILAMVLGILLFMGAYQQHMYLACGFAAGFVVAVFFFAIVYNNVIEQDLLNREF